MYFSIYSTKFSHAVYRMKRRKAFNRSWYRNIHKYSDDTRINLMRTIVKLDERMNGGEQERH